MNPANMKPWGMTSLGLSRSVGNWDWPRAGVHSKTNVYMAPSNNDWIRPRHKTLRSEEARCYKS